MFLRTFNVQVSQNVISTRFWATLNMRKYEPIIFQIPSIPPPKKNVLVPMSSPPPSFMTYQNISPLIKPHAWVLQYIFIFSCLRMQSVQDSVNDSDRRNDFGGGKKCDRNLTEDWYRFSAGAGTSIATKCISKGQRYGTDLPGWMDGARPTVDEGVVSRKVCFSGYQNCCYRHIMINVRNCSSFFVYRLKPVQVCHSRYCGGKARGWNTNLLFQDTVYHYTLIFSRLFNLLLN